MEIFGLTLNGYGNYFTEILKKDYQEPIILPNIKELLEERLRRDSTKSFNEVYNQLDPILGSADGFSYRSYERMCLQKKKGLWKPVGPKDMFRIPATQAQENGFWTPDFLEPDEDWTKIRKNYARKQNDIFKTIDKLRLADPFVVI